MPTAPHDNHFLTVSDIGYLPYVVALHASLRRVGANFSLRIVCLDQEAVRLLERLALTGVTVVPLEDVMRYDPRLRAVEGTRKLAEWAWTMKSAGLRFAFDTEPDLHILTYLDSDILFYDDPKPMFDELGDGSVLIFPHDWAPQWAKRERRTGTYNGGTVVFRNDADGLAVLDDWRERCIESCAVPGCDQIYLNAWPDSFPSVRVSQHPGVALMPVNVALHDLQLDDGRARVDGLSLVFYHYAGHKIYQGITLPARVGVYRSTFKFTPRPVPLVWSAAREVESEEHWHLWRLYSRRLSDAIAELRAVEPAYRTGSDGRARVASLARRTIARAWHRSPPARAAVALRAASPRRRPDAEPPG